MANNFQAESGWLKALADSNRLAIVQLLSGGELCACKILESLQITQPTLSHHMKMLLECGLVFGRKEGKWIHYSLNFQAMNALQAFIVELANPPSQNLPKQENQGGVICE